jgi:polysaccharide export outer membrane protein
MIKSSRFIALALLLCAPSLLAQDAPIVDGTRSTGQTPDARYLLRPGDVLELNFPLVPSFNQTLTIHPDGFVTLRGLRSVHVAGITLPQLTERVSAEYASILRNPVVTIELKEFEKPYFIVAGEVERPGKYDLRGVTTVTQAVAIAGGLKDQAKHSKAAVFRRLPQGGYEVTQLDLKKMLKEAHLNGDVPLQPGDMLFVPKGRRFDFGSLTSSLWLLPYVF